MENKSASSNTNDFLDHAREIYNDRRVTTPENTLATRRMLEEGLGEEGLGISAGVEAGRQAEALSLHAEILMCDYLNRWNDAGSAEVAKAGQAVERALQLAPDLAQAHYANGLVYRARGDHPKSLAAFTRAVSLNPEIPLAHAQQGAALMYTGKPAEALGPIETALRISRPDSRVRAMFYWYMGRAHFFAGNYQDAIPWLRKSAELRPNLWYNRLYQVSACALTGDMTAAMAALRDFDDRFPGYSLARVARDEQTNPNNNEVVVEGRRKFHEGLSRAGMRAAW